MHFALCLLFPAIGARNSAAADDPPASQPDAAFAARLAAMPDNSWLKLDPPREPDGRNYSGVCLGGGQVFYFGGAHVSYQGNDVETYDPKSNAWTRSWQPQARPEQDFGGNAKSGAETVFDPKTGRLWPVHTYQQVCWVPGRKVFFYAGHVGTWLYDPVARTWTNPAGPHSPGAKFTPHTDLAWQTYHTFYSPQLAAPVCIITSKPFGIYVYDLAKAEWTRRGADIPVMMKWYELYSTWVPSRKAHLISQRGSPFMWLYDAAAQTFTGLKDVPEPLQGTQAIAYDSINDAVIALAQFKLDPEARMSKISVTPWVLDLATLAWSEVKSPGTAVLGRSGQPVRPAGFMTGSWAPLWHDADRKVFFFLNRTTQAGCQTWAYRYRRAPAKGPP